MRLRVQDILVQANEVGRREDQIEILQGLGKPETLRSGQPSCIIVHKKR